jgi:Na+/melibiose symporter-like transporter
MKVNDILTATMIATALLAGFLFGIVATDASSSEFWLYRYQKIIAGILAIAAAAWTVFEMRRQDERQQLRHEERITLGVRADRLTVFRYRDVYLATILSQSEKLTAAIATIDAARESAARDHKMVQASVVRSESLLELAEGGGFVAHA